MGHNTAKHMLINRSPRRYDVVDGRCHRSSYSDPTSDVVRHGQEFFNRDICDTYDEAGSVILDSEGMDPRLVQ
jgi:hypothetical protein